MTVRDLLIVGGGVNGAGIARDAVGRGLSVTLCEKGDLGGATSSASTKLIHGGLRYLEYYEFRLVRESLTEREVVLRSAPHIVWPMRFVLPHDKSLRPAWMIRAGLLLYDLMAGRMSLPRSGGVDLSGPPWAAGLKSGLRKGFVYSDCWVDDARLVLLTARDAADRGAEVLTRTACVSARREDGVWRATLQAEDGTRQEVRARAIVNAAGPWVQDVVTGVAGLNAPAGVRLVKGSHIVVPRIHTGEHAYILQNDDRRIVFVIPYEHDFSLIGTTDVTIADMPDAMAIDQSEIDYLIRAVNRWLHRPITPEDVVWTFAGVRPLYDDGKSDPSAITRDYVMALDEAQGAAPLLSVYGGKITTYRRLAETALAKVAPFFPEMGSTWTADALLPGGNIPRHGKPSDDFEAYVDALAAERPDFPRDDLHRLARRHGTRTPALLDGAKVPADLGEAFGGGLTAREVDWLMQEEWAKTAEDVLWRRTKTGLHMTEAQRAAVAEHMARSRAAA